MYKFERRGGGLKFFESTQSEYFYEIKMFFFQKNAPVFAGGGSAPCSLLYPGGTAGAHDKRVSC